MSDLILDVGQRLLAHLNQRTDDTDLQHLPQTTILIAEELTPSDILRLPTDRVRAVALVQGTPTAHIAI